MSKKSKHNRHPHGGARERRPDAVVDDQDGAAPELGPPDARETDTGESREGPRPGEAPAPPGAVDGGMEEPSTADVSGVGTETTSPEEENALPKLTRKEVIDRLFAKNEVIMELHKENKDLAAQLTDLKDRWLRTAAEFENYRKRMRKEWDLLQQQTKAEVILDVLSAVDDFERAFAAAEGADSRDYVEGFRLIYNNLQLSLEKHGVTQIEARHQLFDPNLHMAVGQMESDEFEAGTVVEVVLKGYRLGDTVIRPANVIVAK